MTTRKINALVPAGLVRKEVHFPQGIDCSRQEWFIRGTEPESEDRKTAQFNQRIVYPPTGAVIAVDPDIPAELQKIFFISQTLEEGLHWKLNGSVLDRVGKKVAWAPAPDKYHLAIADGNEKIVDFVYFEVRGKSQN